MPVYDRNEMQLMIDLAENAYTNERLPSGSGKGCESHREWVGAIGALMTWAACSAKLALKGTP